MPRPKSPRRCFLFTPGDNLRMIAKAAQLAPDSVILDLEDAVVPGRKAEARKTVAAALSEVQFERTECLVRVNPVSTDLFPADMEALVAAGPDGIVLPKVETAEQIELVDQSLSTAEEANDLPSGAIRLLALIETALGLMNLGGIARASPRLDCLMFGAEDLAANIGATRTAAGWEVFHARSAVVTAAAAYGLTAIDTVFLDLQDLEALEQEARFARQLGFTGKIAIHPRQVEMIQGVFSPTPEEISQAQRLRDRYREHLANGAGIFTLDGRMVDMPVVRAAESLLERAGLAGLLEKGVG